MHGTNWGGAYAIHQFCKNTSWGQPHSAYNRSLAPKGALIPLARELMAEAHIGAEQVAWLSCEGSLPHLEVMGGGFCINSARAAAMLLAHEGGLFSLAASAGPSGLLFGLLSAPDAPHPVLVLAASSLEIIIQGHALYEQKPFLFTPEAGVPFTAGFAHSLYTSVHLPLLPREGGLSFLANGVPLITLPGSRYLLLNKAVHPAPHSWQLAASALFQQVGLDESLAMGALWYEETKDGITIESVVALPGTDIVHKETASGAGSLALALFLSDGMAQTVTLLQPSGEEFYVTLHARTAEGKSAWLTGPASILARGVAYVQTSLVNEDW